MAGRWKTVFVWGVIAAVVVTYLASFKLPVVAAIEQGVAVVSDQLPSLENVTADLTDFPAHDVDVTGEFVFETPAIYGSHFSAAKGRQIPAGYSAFTSYYDGNMNGFTLYKNIKNNPFGDFYLAMSSSGIVYFSGLSMEVTELSAQQLLGVRTYPLINYWTTNPGDDLPVGAGEVPPAPDEIFYGDNFKVTVIKMTANNIQIPNFSLSVTPGTK